MRSTQKLRAWRVVAAKFDKDGQPVSLFSTYTNGSMPFKEVLADPKGFHVGTKRKFCLSYYTGMVTETDEVKEVVLTLEIDPKDLQKPDMIRRWGVDESFMGNEAIVTKARVLFWKFAAPLVK